MEHLAAIADWTVRNAVATAQMRFESMLLDLLPADADEAERYLEDAKRRITREIKSRDEIETIDAAAQHASDTLALAILDKSFERLLAALR